VCEVTSRRKMAGRHFRNRSITCVEDSIGGTDSNEVDEISILDNTAIYRRQKQKELSWQSAKVISVPV
jgi:hypothetical protein